MIHREMASQIKRKKWKEEGSWASRRHCSVYSQELRRPKLRCGDGKEQKLKQSGVPMFKYKAVSLKTSTSQMNIEIRTSHKMGKYLLFPWTFWAWKRLLSLGRSGSWRHQSLFPVLRKWDVFKERKIKWMYMSTEGSANRRFFNCKHWGHFW